MTATTTAHTDAPSASWVLQRELARGPFATVHRALRPTDGAVGALKMLAAGADAVTLERFAREREILRGLDHPRIPALLDDGTSERGVPWLVTALVEGDTLADQLSTAPDTLDLATVVEQIGDALAHAHARGVVHRDLSPRNVICAANGAHLIDLGIAHRDGMPELTSDSSALGTLAYAAPEQLDGGHCGPASDVYGLAACTFAALVGRPPHPGASPAEVLTRRLAGEREHLVARSPEGRAVVTLLEPALRHEPADRPADVGVWSSELAEALDQLRGPFSAHLAAAVAERTSAIEIPAARQAGAQRRWTLAVAATAACTIAGAVAVVSQRDTVRTVGPQPLELTTGPARVALPAGWIRLGDASGGTSRAANPATGATVALHTALNRAAPPWADRRAIRTALPGALLWRSGSQARLVVSTRRGPVGIDCAGGPDAARDCLALARKLRGPAPRALPSTVPTDQRVRRALRTATASWSAAPSERVDGTRLAERAAASARAAEALRRVTRRTGWAALPELADLATTLDRSAVAIRLHARSRSRSSWRALVAAEARLRTAVRRAGWLIPVPRVGQLRARPASAAPTSGATPSTPSPSGGDGTGSGVGTGASTSGTGARGPQRQPPSDSSTSSGRQDDAPAQEEPIVVGPAL